MSKILLSLLLVLSPVLSFSQAVESGGWPDGSKFAWQCHPKASGLVKFVFVTPDGKAYEGTLSCGSAT